MTRSQLRSGPNLFPKLTMPTVHRHVSASMKSIYTLARWENQDLGTMILMIEIVNHLKIETLEVESSHSRSSADGPHTHTGTPWTWHYVTRSSKISSFLYHVSRQHSIWPVNMSRVCFQILIMKEGQPNLHDKFDDSDRAVALLIRLGSLNLNWWRRFKQKKSQGFRTSRPIHIWLVDDESK